jgi:hypothetical protein
MEIESDRFKGFTYDDLLKRDKVNLDLFWLRDESLEDSANLPDPDVLTLEIANSRGSGSSIGTVCGDCGGFEALASTV